MIEEVNTTGYEISPTSRATCRVCNNLILKGTVRRKYASYYNHSFRHIMCNVGQYNLTKAQAIKIIARLKYIQKSNIRNYSDYEEDEHDNKKGT